MDKSILTPTEEERQAAVRRIVELSAAVDRTPQWRRVPLSVLLFGIEDCLFLTLLAALLGMIPGAAAARSVPMAALLFLFSPALYAALYLLTSWKDSATGMAEWRKSCRLSSWTLLALRMLVFGGLAAALCVPGNLLLWAASGRRCSLLWMLGLSFSSLFLYAALTLFCLRRRQWKAVPPALWAVLGTLLLAWEQSAELLLQVPALVFFLLAVSALLYCILILGKMLRYPYDSFQGGRLYADS